MVEIEGRFVTFTPPTDAAYLMGDFTDWDDESLPIAGPVTLEFPPGASIEYAYREVYKQPFADPTNHEQPKTISTTLIALSRFYKTISRHLHDHISCIVVYISI